MSKSVKNASCRCARVRFLLLGSLLFAFTAIPSAALAESETISGGLVAAPAEDAEATTPVVKSAKPGVKQVAYTEVVKHTALKPVMKEGYETKRYTVYRPSWETRYRQQTITCYKPVREVSYREDCKTVYKLTPVQKVCEQRYVVQKPVWEERERIVVEKVRVPCTQTVMKPCTQTVMKPCTVMKTSTVDKGCYVDEVRVRKVPGRTVPSWQPARTVVDPATCERINLKPSFYWKKMPDQEVCDTVRVWKPNLVTVETPVTTYNPVTVVKKVPVEVKTWTEKEVRKVIPERVCRYESQVVVKKVPVTNYVWKPQIISRKIPVETVRQVAYKRTINVPYKVCVSKPEVYEEKVLVQRCEMVPVETETIVEKPASIESQKPAAGEKVESEEPADEDKAKQVPVAPHDEVDAMRTKSST